MTRWLIALFALVLVPSQSSATTVSDLKVTVLSTMLANEGLGEWGYAALVEVGGRRILFDTGARPETVLANARELRIDLATVEDVVISHGHYDHTGGLVTLRRELMKSNPKALSRVHVGQGVFVPRVNGGPYANLAALRTAYEQLGGRFIEHDKPVELLPGVWMTGPIPRVYPERNYGLSVRVLIDGKPEVDTVAEDSALIFETPEGLVVLSGCGHAGVVNTATYGRKFLGERPVVAIIGGLHLVNADDATLDWTGEQLRAYGLKYLLAGHCTGLEATYRLRAIAHLDRRTAAYGAVGSTFEIGRGIDPRPIAR